MSCFSLLVWKTSLWMTSPQMMTLRRRKHHLKVYLTSLLSWHNEKKPNCICIFSCLLFTAPTKVSTWASQHPQRRSPSQCDSVFVSEEEDDIVVKSTWRTRHSKPSLKTKVKNVLCDEAESSATGLVSSPCSLPGQTATSLTTPKHTLSAPLTIDDSLSSEEEFTSLLERLKKKNKFPSSTFCPQNTQGSCFLWIFTLHYSYFYSDFPLCSSCCVVFSSEGSKDPPVSGKGFKKPASRSLGEPPVDMQTPDKSTILKPTFSQTEPRHNPLSRYS